MNFNSKTTILSFCTFLLFFCGNLIAQDTNVMIRALAKDAKFIGTSIGGAKIIIRDAETGEILDEGITTGSTGNTNLIVEKARERYEQRSDDNAAGYNATLDIKEPTFVTVEAIAPINKKQARVVSSTQLWIIPGKDITGDGLVLEVPGFVVDILSPQTHETITASNEIDIKANVVMMCGCPVTEDGIWDANQYEIKALITAKDGTTREMPLKATNKSSTFKLETTLEKGLYEIAVYAYDPITGNTGLDKTNIIIK